MANQSATAFGLRPLRNVGQADHNAGLSEWKKLSGAAAINHHELCILQNSGYVLSAIAGGVNNIGSLNGSFYTDPTTSKPTWSNYAPSVAASDHVCLINDNPQTMFEMRTSITTFTNPGSVGKCSPIVVGAGSGAPNYISGNSIGATGVGTDQIKVLPEILKIKMCQSQEASGVL